MALASSPWLSALSLAFALLLCDAEASTVAFDYNNQSTWLSLSDSSCGGSRQSPIDIASEDVQVDVQLSHLDFSQGWDLSRAGSIINEINSVRFTPSTTGEAAITSTPAGAYSVDQFHLHWGRANTEGSEHRVDGRAFAGEMHFVHAKQPAAAAGVGDKIAVVGILLEADDTLVVSGSPWEALMLPVMHDQELNISSITYSDFLPRERSYYHYEGSLTTPLCNEVVQWFLLRQPVKIPSAFLQQLRTVQKNDAGAPLLFNFRDTQPLQGRTVRTAGATAATVSSVLLTVIGFLVAQSYA